jgi:transcriptional regulator with AAA-type ATPase domain
MYSKLAAHPYSGEEIVGRSPPFQAVLDLVGLFAIKNSVTLIHGETGNGKEVTARANALSVSPAAFKSTHFRARQRLGHATRGPRKGLC